MRKTILIEKRSWRLGLPTWGARKVWWKVDGKWVAKGWLMPKVKQ